MIKQLLLICGLLGLFASNAAEARFVSVDPVQANKGKNFNRYHYANNNPYKFTDPDGRQSIGVESLYEIQQQTEHPELLRAQEQASERTIGLFLTGTDIDYVAPKGSGEITPAFTIMESVGASAATRGISGLLQSEGQGATTTVGRWMSDAEHGAMLGSGRVQESTLGGVTSVSSPPNPGAWVRQTSAPNYVEFSVPASSVRPLGSPNAKIYGPGSIFGPRLGITEMPRATNVVQTACRVPYNCN